MSSYEYTLPTTGAFFYSSCIHAEGTAGDLLSRASQHRAQLRDVLKRLKRSDHKDISSVIKTIEDYLPSLARIYHTLKTLTTAIKSAQEMEARMEITQPIVTSWRATFHDQKIPGKAFARLDLLGIEAEVIFVLLTYAYALSNYALLPSHEPQRIVSLLAQAAGVFAYLSTKGELYTTRTSKSCPELAPEFAATLERLTCGEAQMAALTQLREKASNSVLCRIAVAASDHFSSAAGILSSNAVCKTIPNDFRQHLVKRLDSAMSRAYYYLALEQEKVGQVGFAVACAGLAEKLHKMEETITLLRVLTKENQQVTFQLVPSREEVQARLPSGRDFVKAIKFTVFDMRENRDLQTDHYAGNGAYY